MKIFYLISESFSYEKLICADAGPEYAGRLGLPLLHMSELRQDFQDVVLVDTRLEAGELERVRIMAYAGLKVLFRANDPGFETEGNRPLTKVILESASVGNVGLVLSYQPSEVTQLMAWAYGPERVYRLPFPYLSSMERIKDGPKIHKVVISGNSNAQVYPLRAFGIRKRLTSLGWRRMTEVLPHPGYLDINSNGVAGLSGQSYFQFLARFGLMFLCPSRHGVELMKFTECAYALCCPVGEPARTLPSEAADLFVRFGPESWKTGLSEIVEMTGDEAVNRAMKYREIMRRERDPAKLRHDFVIWTQGKFGASPDATVA